MSEQNSRLLGRACRSPPGRGCWIHLDPRPHPLEKACGRGRVKVSCNRNSEYGSLQK